MWMYNSRYPEIGLKEFEIKNKTYLVEEDDSRTLYSVESDYNIEYGMYDKSIHCYHIYQPYSDNRLYECDNGMMSYVLSFDYEVIYNNWKEDLIYKKKRLEDQLKKCIDAIDNR